MSISKGKSCKTIRGEEKEEPGAIMITYNAQISIEEGMVLQVFTNIVFFLFCRICVYANVLLVTRISRGGINAMHSTLQEHWCRCFSLQLKGNVLPKVSSNTNLSRRLGMQGGRQQICSSWLMS